MTALSNDQRFVVLLLIAVASGAWLSSGTNAQAFTPEDRGSILKFMDVLLNFLDADVADNATSTETPNNASTTTIDDGESTTLAGNSTTDISTETESTTADNTTESTASSESDEVTSESTTLIPSETILSTTTPSSISTTTQVTAAPRRICFKRVCYKFAADKGYIV
ncbi:uncharacterized protein LOC6565752 [Drosophila grimshawi]|uniref:GH24677 n=1 Tax=Drosophila grimshawi TaxID=7222 RepID=B4JMR4_DROGR|nr:uncharacterized protein LOC6565752 [Drosophila grimshawi]EDV92007.1 GH24677 [Drosophila grimshawi]